jgi:hypothetical protein
MRELYGPQKGRETNPFWAKIKVTVKRRERVYEQLVKEIKAASSRFSPPVTKTAC